LTRRQALAGTAAIGLGLAVGRSGRSAAETRAGAKMCLLTPEAVEGPFYFDPKLLRTDITEGKPGAKLKLALQVVEAGNCAALEGARIDVWHSDAVGVYSGYARQETGSTEGQTFLRGTQRADADGKVGFDTIYPGWYPGRTPHIHFKVFLNEAEMVTGQLYFPDSLTERIYATTSPYRARKGERDVFNANDSIFQRQGGPDTLATVTEQGGAYRAALVIGVDR
jgi:protocatechuate 3,4-dioxygenase beta subunit